MRTPSIVLIALLIGCGSTAQSTPEPTTAEPEPAPAPAEASPPAAALMQQHFTDVAAARDAVIRGNLEGVRAPLTQVADAIYGVDFPPSWVVWVTEMQEVARAGADARSLDEAGSSIATLARACGDCHRTTGSGPSVDSADTEPPEAGQMVRHAWAMDQLWLGITIPSRDPWMRGTEALLSDTTLAGEQGEGDARSVHFTEHMAELRAIASEAQDAAHLGRKATVYGQLISQCSHCHTEGS